MPFSTGIKEIDALHMTSLHIRPLKAEMAIKNAGLIIIKLKNGRWWSSLGRFNNRHINLRNFGWSEKALLQGLAMLGIITKSSADQALKAADKYKGYEEVREHLWRLRQLAKAFPKQKGIIRKVAKKCKLPWKEIK